MKTFVIKNKEGKYLQYFTDMYRFGFTDRLINAMFYEQWEQDSINYVLKTIPDCEVVPVTIAEGDLEQENKQLKEQLERKMDLIGELDGYFEDIFTELNPNWRWDEKWQGGMKEMYKEAIREIKELKQQLKNKIKFKLHQKVFVIIDNGIFEGQIDAYDVYTQKYLVFIGTDDIDDLGFGNEWMNEDSIFATKKQAKEIGKDER